MRRSTLPLLLALLLASPLLRAQQLERFRFGAEPAGSVQNAPALATSGNTIYLAWSDYRSGSNGEIYLTRSTDGGWTFDTPRPVISSGGVMGAMRRGVAMTADNRGRLHLAWINSAGGKLDLVYSRSTDSGTTFTTPRPIAPPVGITANVAMDFPSIAADSTGGVYVVWIDNRDLLSGTTTYTQLLSTRSLDGGTIWDAPVRASRYDVPGGSCECCNTALAATPEGTVVAVYRSNISNRRDVFLARSRNRGGEFELAVPVPSESWTIPACPMTGPAIALDRNALAHIVWRDGRASTAGKPPIFYTTVGPESNSAVPDRSVSRTPSRSNFPAIALTPQGALVVAFEDSRNDASDLMSVISTDGGSFFPPIPTQLSDDGSASTKQDLAAAATLPDGARVFAWHDEGTNENDIILAIDRSTLELTPPGRVALAAPLGGTLEPGEIVLRWEAPLGIDDDRSTLYDVALETPSGWQHRRVNGTRSVVDTLAPGVYRWSVIALSSVGRSAAADTATFTVGEASEVPALPTIHVRTNTVRLGERVEIEIGRGQHRAQLRMIDAAGRTVASREIEAGATLCTFDTHSLSGGVYRVENGLGESVTILLLP